MNKPGHRETDRKTGIIRVFKVQPDVCKNHPNHPNRLLNMTHTVHDLWPHSQLRDTLRYLRNVSVFCPYNASDWFCVPLKNVIQDWTTWGRVNDDRFISSCTVPLKQSGAHVLYSQQPVLIIAINMICVLKCKFPGKTAPKSINVKQYVMNGSVYCSVVYRSQKKKITVDNSQ